MHYLMYRTAMDQEITQDTVPRVLGYSHLLWTPQDLKHLASTRLRVETVAHMRKTFAAEGEG